MRLCIVIWVIHFLVFIKCHESYYSNEWIVRLKGGSERAKMIAEDTGYTYVGPVIGFDDTYIFTEREQSIHQKRAQTVISTKLIEDQRVLWAEQQYFKPRQKRNLPKLPNSFIQHKKNYIENLRNIPLFNDELWLHEWYLHDTRTRSSLPKLDLNVLPVYKAGITGKGVRVTILDDGIEHTHDDLKNNYDPSISWDCNENDADPKPRYGRRSRNSHGTRCAGEVAMSANNRKCGVGIAFDARIGGVKLLDGHVNDRIEGTALGFAHKLVDIYSASWGPNDDGKTVDGPASLAREALKRGITEGRGGKGAIYVWASGNGGVKDDNCNCDGYLASPYTVSIGSASQHGAFPWYGERCASTLAVTYSSGAYQDQMIATTDIGNKCTIKHTGTSASAPLAAGIIALALQANPELTWRDVQHLIVWTSDYGPVADNPDWQQNAAGFWFSTKFGFGLMNAYSLVSAAINWTTVPAVHSCKLPAVSLLNNTLMPNQSLVLRFPTQDCYVEYLEHVEVTVNIEYSVRGHLELYLTSATGTKVELLRQRKLDKSKKGFKNWTFMSVMTWNENPKGHWFLEITDKVGEENSTGFVTDVLLTLHGTVHLPTYMRNGPRKYHRNYNLLQTNILDYDINYL